MRRVVWSVLIVAVFLSFGLAAHYMQQANELRQKISMLESEKQRAQEFRETESRRAPAPNLIATLTGGGISNQAAAAAEMEGRIRQLEADLQNKNVLIVSLQQAATNRPAESARSARRLQGWLDDLKQNNPQQYAVLTQRWEQARQTVESSFAEKEAYLQSRDPAAMSEQELAAYQQMTGLLNETWQLAELMRTDLPRSDRRAAMQTLRQNMRQLDPMLKSERSKEWYNMGLQLGYKEEDAVAFRNYINDVIDLTDMQSIYRNMRRGAVQPQNPATPSVPAPGR